MNYFIEENNNKVYVRREFGHYEKEKLFGIDLTTFKITLFDGNPDLPDFTHDELVALHTACAEHYQGNETLTLLVEEEMSFRKHISDYKVPVLRCIDGVWTYQMVGDVE